MGGVFPELPGPLADPGVLLLPGDTVRDTGTPPRSLLWRCGASPRPCSGSRSGVSPTSCCLRTAPGRGSAAPSLLQPWSQRGNCSTGGDPALVSPGRLLGDPSWVGRGAWRLWPAWEAGSQGGAGSGGRGAGSGSHTSQSCWHCDSSKRRAGGAFPGLGGPSLAGAVPHAPAVGPEPHVPPAPAGAMLRLGAGTGRHRTARGCGGAAVGTVWGWRGAGCGPAAPRCQDPLNPPLHFGVALSFPFPFSPVSFPFSPPLPFRYLFLLYLLFILSPHVHAVLQCSPHPVPAPSPAGTGAAAGSFPGTVSR